RRKPRAGAVLGSALVLYPLWRFIAEFWRPDNAPYWPGGLTFSQGISLACLAAGVALLLRRPEESASPAFPFRPASKLHLAAAMAAVCVSLSSASCATHGAGGVHPMQGVSKYRKANGQNSKKADSTPDDGDWFSDCMNDCVGDCIDDCIDEACDDSCSSKDDPEEAAPTPMQTVLAELEPGREYKGAIAIVGEVNERLEVRLGLNGTIQTAPSE